MALQVNAAGNVAESRLGDNNAVAEARVDLPPDRFAGNQDPGSATDLGGLYQTISENNLNIANGFEADFFKFNLSTPGQAADFLSVLRHDGVGHSQLQIFDKNGNLVATNDPAFNLDPTQGTGSDTLSLSGLAAGEYYIAVQSIDATPFYYDLILSSSGRTGPGLAVTDFLAPSEIAPTLATHVIADIANYGSVTAFNIPVQVQLDDGNGHVTTVASATIASLASGATQELTLTVNIPAGVAQGDYTLHLIVDPANTIPDGNTTDNSFTSPVKVTRLPDALRNKISRPEPSPSASFEAHKPTRT